MKKRTPLFDQWILHFLIKIVSRYRFVCVCAFEELRFIAVCHVNYKSDFNCCCDFMCDERADKCGCAIYLSRKWLLPNDLSN